MQEQNAQSSCCTWVLNLVTSVDLKSLQQTAVEHRERNKNFWKKPVWYIPVLLAGVAAVAGLWTIIMK